MTEIHELLFILLDLIFDMFFFNIKFNVLFLKLCPVKKISIYYLAEPTSVHYVKYFYVDISDEVISLANTTSFCRS